MCDFCEFGVPGWPSSADVPEMDVTMELERWQDITSGKSGTSLVVYKEAADAEARFDVKYCPICGKALAERGM